MDSRDLLSNLPEEVLEKILLEAENPQTIINSSLISKQVNTLFSKSYKLQKVSDFALDCLREVLNRSALGEWESAKTIWLAYPDLLNLSGTVYFPNRTYIPGLKPVDVPLTQHPGRYKYINRTAFQIAMMNEAWEAAGEMAEYMDEAEKQKQFYQVFPDGKIKHQRLDLNAVKQLLNALFAAVLHDTTITDLNSMNETTTNALYSLYEYIKPELTQQSGIVFDTQFYVCALQLYETRYSELCEADEMNAGDRRSFWRVRVAEYIAALLCTAILSDHSEGIVKGMRITQPDGTVVDINMPIPHPVSSIHPFRRSSDSIPGFHFFVTQRGSCASTFRMIGKGQGQSDRILQRIAGRNESRDKFLERIFPKNFDCKI